MPLEEVLLIVDDLRAERKNLTSAQRIAQPLQDHLRTYIQTKQLTADVLPSLEYSLDLHRYHPLVDQFRTTLWHQALPELLHDAVLASIDKLCDAIGQAASFRMVSVGRGLYRMMKRAELLDLISAHFPLLSDATLGRLKVILNLEATRVTQRDSKLTSVVVPKDDVVLDFLFAAVPQDERGGAAAPRLWYRTNCSLLQPFASAIIRGSVLAYDGLQQQLLRSVASSLSGDSTWSDGLAATVLHKVVPTELFLKAAADVKLCAASAATVTEQCADATLYPALGSVMTLQRLAAIVRSTMCQFSTPANAALASGGADDNILDSQKLLDMSRKVMTIIRTEKK
jgi:hypothetical protein